MPETLGSASVIARSSAPSRAGSPRTVAMCVWGAASSNPGEAMSVKFIARLRHCTSRRLAIFRSTSRPSTLTVMVSPIPMPQPRARLASKEVRMPSSPR